MERIITFSVNGNEITGKLMGDAHLWSFKSETEYFKNNFRTGEIKKHTLLKELNTINRQKEIYSLVCEEAELKEFY